MTGGESLAAGVLTEPEVIDVGSLRILPDEFIAEYDGERLSLTPKQFQLLVLFARNPGRLLRREVIAKEVWNDDAPGRTIDIHIARLRSHLPSRSIETVIRIGYRFRAE